MPAHSCRNQGSVACVGCHWEQSRLPAILKRVLEYQQHLWTTERYQDETRPHEPRWHKSIHNDHKSAPPPSLPPSAASAGDCSGGWGYCSESSKPPLGFSLCFSSKTFLVAKCNELPPLPQHLSSTANTNCKITRSERGDLKEAEPHKSFVWERLSLPLSTWWLTKFILQYLQ